MAGPALTFAIQQTESAARAGVITTPHGVITTPMFMPVGTSATVKAVAPDDLTSLGAQIILSNTYHLFLRPGPQIIANFGGLHGFMNWQGPIITDSGGFQVFSLGQMRKITGDSVIFRSHLDGARIELNPKRVMEIEAMLGADIILPLDECPPFPCEETVARRATERTHRWAEMALNAKVRSDQALFGIPQGGMFAELRHHSAETIGALPFDGFSIGGLSVGEPKPVMWDMLDATISGLPNAKPRHLLGVGSPEDLVEGIARGVDVFDCVLPTRAARNGGLYTRSGRVSIRTARWKEERGPVDSSCDCWTCANFSAGYLNHLARAEELLFFRLASIHNLRFLIRLVTDARAAIVTGNFAAWRAEFHAAYRPASAEASAQQREKWRAKHGVNPDMAHENIRQDDKKL